jgi:transposase
LPEGIEALAALDDFEVLSASVDGGVAELRVRSTFPAACPHCGSTAVAGHGRCERRVRDLPLGRPTVLVWEQRRLRCRDCGRTGRERHPAVPERRSITHRLRRLLFEESCRRPFSEVAAAHGVSAWRVVEAFDALAPSGLADAGSPRVLALDESAFRRGMRFHTVLFDPLARTALAVAGGRDRRAAELLLFGLPAQVRAGVETVVIDCHWPFRKAAAEALPGARVVADKFHVLRAVDAAAQRVRQRHGRKPRTDLVGPGGGTSRVHNPRHDRAVYRARWAFMRRAGRLAAGDRAALAAVFAAHPEVACAWAMKEAFAAVYDAPDRAEGARRLAVWEHNLPAAGLPELTRTWGNLQWWRDEILNYFDDRQTNAFAEGATNKVKVMKRRSYGFRNAQRYRHKVLLTIGRRPG